MVWWHNCYRQTGGDRRPQIGVARLTQAPLDSAPCWSLNQLGSTFLASLVSRQPLLPKPVHDSAPCQVIRTQLDRNPVAGEDANEVFAHASRNMGQGLVLIFKLHPEHGIGQDLDDHCHHFNCIFLRQTNLLVLLVAAYAPLSILLQNSRIVTFPRNGQPSRSSQRDLENPTLSATNRIGRSEIVMRC